MISTCFRYIDCKMGDNNYVFERAFFREVLPNQSVCVFIEPPFPGTVWMGKINVCIQRVSYFLVLRELFSIVNCNGVDLFFEC